MVHVINMRVEHQIKMDLDETIVSMQCQFEMHQTMFKISTYFWFTSRDDIKRKQGHD